MESLRKYLGYVFFGLVLLASAVGVIIYCTDIINVFKGVNSFETFLQTALAYIARIVCWTIIAIMSIVTLTKLNNMNGQQKDYKGVTLVVIAAIAEFIGAVGLMIVYFKAGAAGNIPGKLWALAIVCVLIFVADIVRKVSFGKNVLVNKIMCAAIALVMFVVVILLMEGTGGKLLVTFVLWMLTYAGLVANPLLSSPLNKAE